jgi:hypothetical protein
VEDLLMRRKIPFILFVFFLAACGGANITPNPPKSTLAVLFSPTPPNPTPAIENSPTPSNPTPAIESSPTPISAPNPTETIQAAFGQVDQQLKDLLNANIAFTRPDSMKLGDTTNVDLILNPSQSEADLATQVVKRAALATSTAQPGTLVAPGGQIISVETGQIEITPRMKAVLISQDPEAFLIAPAHDSAEQVISATDPTLWRWSVTAKKVGSQTLELVVYRLVKYDNQDFWREVQTYDADIKVQVTPLQQLQSLDWEWIAGAILIPLAVALWGWLRSRKKTAAPSRRKQN